MPSHDSGIKCIWCSQPIRAITGEKSLRGYVMYLEGVSTPEGHYHDPCLKELQKRILKGGNRNNP